MKKITYKLLFITSMKLKEKFVYNENTFISKARAFYIRKRRRFLEGRDIDFLPFFSVRTNVQMESMRKRKEARRESRGENP